MTESSGVQDRRVLWLMGASAVTLIGLVVVAMIVVDPAVCDQADQQQQLSCQQVGEFWALVVRTIGMVLLLGATIWILRLGRTVMGTARADTPGPDREQTNHEDEDQHDEHP